MMWEAQWLSWYSVRLGIEGLLVRVLPPAESLCYVLEQDTLSSWKTHPEMTEKLLNGTLE